MRKQGGVHRTTGDQKYEDLERSLDVFALCAQKMIACLKRQKKKEEWRKRGRRRRTEQCVCSHDCACRIQGPEGDFSSLLLVNHQLWREAVQRADAHASEAILLRSEFWLNCPPSVWPSGYLFSLSVPLFLICKAEIDNVTQLIDWMKITYIEGLKLCLKC